jgi:hypothetical protein
MIQTRPTAFAKGGKKIKDAFFGAKVLLLQCLGWIG